MKREPLASLGGMLSLEEGVIHKYSGKAVWLDIITIPFNSRREHLTGPLLHARQLEVQGN